METDKISFPEAVRVLAARANIPVPEDTYVSPAEQAKRQERQLLYKVNEWVAGYFHAQLLRAPEAEAARRYLQQRGFSSEIIRAVKIGYALPDWTGLLRAAGRNNVPVDALAKLGLIIPRKQKGFYDRFRGRVMIPIADERGRIVAFGGRVLDDSVPKYLNSPENMIFNKGKLLFGLRQAGTSIGRAGYAVLVEGYMDCLAAWQYGVGQVVASLGTALTREQARLLKRYTEQAVLCYDADNAGIQAALRGLDILRQEGLEVRVATLPDGEDPDDCLRKRGVDYFRKEILGKAAPSVEFQLDVLQREYCLDEVAGKAHFVEAATAVLAGLDNEVAKVAYAQQLAAKLQVPANAVLAELAKQERLVQHEVKNKHGNSRNTNKDIVHTVVMDDPVLRGCQIAENKLLSLILTGLVDAEELLLEWQSLDVYAYPADRRLVEFLLAELQEGKVLDVKRLMEQIEDKEMGQRLAHIAWTEDLEEERAAVVARDCLLKLKQLAVRHTISDIQERLSIEKNPKQRKQLLEELQVLLVRQKGLRP